MVSKGNRGDTRMVWAAEIEGFMAERERETEWETWVLSALKSWSIANQHLTQKNSLWLKNGVCSCSHGCENVREYLAVGSHGFFFSLRHGEKWVGGGRLRQLGHHAAGSVWESPLAQMFFTSREIRGSGAALLTLNHIFCTQKANSAISQHHFTVLLCTFSAYLRANFILNFEGIGWCSAEDVVWLWSE